MTDADLLAVLGVGSCDSDEQGTCRTHASHWVGTRCEYVMGLLDGTREGIALAKAGISAILLERSALCDATDEHGKGLRYGGVVASAWQPESTFAVPQAAQSEQVEPLRHRHAVTVEELTPDESRVLFDSHARQLFDMSGDEFLRRYDAGELEAGVVDHSALTQMVMLLPFGR